MSNITITQLPTAGALTGTEAVPVVQNGVTVQTTTGAIQATSNLTTYPFLMTQATSALGSSRYVATGSGLSTADGGAGSTFTINLTGAPLSLVTSSAGIQVKTDVNTVVNRTISVTGSGLSVTNGDGISGNPTISTTGVLANFASTSGTGLLTINGTTISQTTLSGTTGQITVTNPSGIGGNPTFSLNTTGVSAGTYTIATVAVDVYGRITSASSASTTGSGAVVLQASPTLTGVPAAPTAALNTNTTQLATTAFVLQQVSSSGGGTVTSITAGTGLSGGTITSSGTIAIANTAVTAGSYTNANITINAQGQITSATSGSAGGVTTFQTSLSGLTPSTATSGAITLAGTLGGTSGGTGVNNGSSTITIAGNLTHAGAFTQSFTATANTAVTLPTSGTLISSVTALSGAVTGTPSSTTYLRGDSTWATISTSSGTVTSVSFTGGLISVATATTTPALTVAGTSGGLVYFSSASTWASSTVLIANSLMIGGGAGVAPSTITTGTGVVTALGVNTGSSGAFVVNGGALGTPSSGTVTNLTGTASININGTVGATTPTTGAFTTVSASGQITSTVTTGTAPFVVASTTQVANLNAATAGTATNATNLALTAGSGATNYITYAASATGNQPQYTSTSITINATNSTITGGINGGTF